MHALPGPRDGAQRGFGLAGAAPKPKGKEWVLIYLTPIKRQILKTMRVAQGEHLGTSDIAAELDEPVFRVRAEMQDLRRQRLVRQDTSRRRLEWALTDLGTQVAWDEQQLGLEL